MWRFNCESVSASERQDEEQMSRETGTRQGRIPPTGDPHRGEGPEEDPPPEGRATQGTHTEPTQTVHTYIFLNHINERHLEANRRVNFAG